MNFLTDTIKKKSPLSTVFKASPITAAAFARLGHPISFSLYHSFNVCQYEEFQEALHGLVLVEDREGRVYVTEAELKLRKEMRSILDATLAAKRIKA